MLLPTILRVFKLRYFDVDFSTLFTNFVPEFSTRYPNENTIIGHCPAGPLHSLNVSCWAQKEHLNSLMLKGYAARLYARLYLNAGLDAGPVQLSAVPVRCRARIAGEF